MLMQSGKNQHKRGIKGPNPAWNRPGTGLDPTCKQPETEEETMPPFDAVWFSIGVLIGVMLGLVADGLHRAAKREREWKEKRLRLPRAK